MKKFLYGLGSAVVVAPLVIAAFVTVVMVSLPAFSNVSQKPFTYADARKSVHSIVTTETNDFGVEKYGYVNGREIVSLNNCTKSFFTKITNCVNDDGTVILRHSTDFSYAELTVSGRTLPLVCDFDNVHKTYCIVDKF